MSADLTIERLRCEYLINPLGIDERSPRLSWALASSLRGQRQTAYQLLVARSLERLSANAGDLWDTGKIESDQSAQIDYKGLALMSSQRCYWKVRVWDKDGNDSAYSQPAWWEMGLLAPEDWRGKWIGSAASEIPDLQPSPYLRTVFSTAKPIQQARIYATAKGVYELWLNGSRVGDALFAPGWTDYDQRIQYQTYDVTSQVQRGENAIGAVLGAGWYSGYVGFDNRCKYYGSRPQLLLQLHLVYVDGTENLIVSDEQWKVSTSGAIRASDLLMGETYDARIELSNWNVPQFDDSSWESVAAQAHKGVKLVADCAEPVRITQQITPKTITQVGEQRYVCDMGQNMVGWVRLHAQGGAGTSITLRFAEMLNPDGTIYTDNLRSALQTDTFILKGAGSEVFEPHFTFHGFRYVEIVGYPGIPTIEDITGCVIHSAAPISGSFSCSNEMVNQLYQNIVWGQRGNFLSVPTDCPQRNERLGWLGDAQVFVRTACWNMDVVAFFTKWMVDVEDAQSSAGAFPCVAPRLARLEDGAPAWGDAGVIIPWTIYRVYGDKRIIERHWQAMVRWMDYLQQGSPGMLWVGRLSRNYGDWLSIRADTPKEVLATAYFAYDAFLMAEMAKAIDRPDEAINYRNLYEAIKQAFIAAYVTADGRVRGETQTAYALALQMNLLPDNWEATADHLVEDIASRNGHLSTGFVGVSYLCPALTATGHVDVAYQLLNNTSFPSWGYSIKQGATTMWERWDGWTEENGFQTPEMNSFNHYAFGSVGQWLFQTVAGIEADKPGFEHIVIHPQPGGGLTHVRAEYDSMKGPIVSEWRLNDEVFTLSISIPANSGATVYIPTKTTGQVKERGIPVERAEGVSVVQHTSEALVLAISSGSYMFESHLL